MERSFLLIGLGNPGKGYEDTRHNIGFRIIKAFAAKYSMTFRPSLTRAKGTVAHGDVEGKKIILLLPMTYMNESGRSVRKTMDYYKIEKEQIIVVTDDVHLPFGELRMRWKGSSGGHKGLENVGAYLASQEYPRLRIGVGRDNQDELADYVLGKFSQEEQRKLPNIVDKANRALDLWIEEGIEAAMQKTNSQISLGEK